VRSEFLTNDFGPILGQLLECLHYLVARGRNGRIASSKISPRVTFILKLMNEVAFRFIENRNKVAKSV